MSIWHSIEAKRKTAKSIAVVGHHAGGEKNNEIKKNAAAETGPNQPVQSRPKR